MELASVSPEQQEHVLVLEMRGQLQHINTGSRIALQLPNVGLRLRPIPPLAGFIVPLPCMS